ncbi:TPA: hypothetical protein I8Y21_005359 [Klebsiella oxytoca]|uniref:Uncharacterized protein n=1 Tax=Klebsiella oxytoca TaxID=571 RepID=A0AAN5LDM7_KLEOX|nr:hypothetical protein [Klebsiella oxytoca]
MSDVIRYGVAVVLLFLFLSDVFFLTMTGKQIRERTRKGEPVPRRTLILLNLLPLVGICLVAMVIIILSGGC